MQGMQKIYNNDGIAGFFNGLLPRIFRKALGSVVCWTIYEFLIDKEDFFMNIGS